MGGLRDLGNAGTTGAVIGLTRVAQQVLTELRATNQLITRLIEVEREATGYKPPSAPYEPEGPKWVLVRRRNHHTSLHGRRGRTIWQPTKVGVIRGIGEKGVRIVYDPGLPSESSVEVDYGKFEVEA